jgi:hypothetical protein
MSWPQFALARQLLSEERIGTAVRQAAADEDAEFDKSREALAALERRVG